MMSNLIETYENKQINKLTSKKSIPAFRSGDTIKVTLKIIEGERSRLQSFEGVCIARKNNLLNSKFTIRKISHGEGVERVFPLFSPNIDKIEVIRKGNVKRAKLYFLRKRKGKNARIADRDRGEEIDEYSISEIADETNEINETNKENVSEENVQDEDKTNKPLKEAVVAEEKKSVDNKSESTASSEAKTKDESK